MTRSSEDSFEIAGVADVDVDTAHEVREAVQAVLTKGRPARIQLNMRLVTFIDSVGLGMVVAVLKRARSLGGHRLA